MLNKIKNKRSDTVLKLIIEHYLTNGSPIASKCISTHPDVNASSATVRNVMGCLEKEGFIYSPHTSAGRIPSISGLKYFIQDLLAESTQSNALQQLSANLVQADNPNDMCQKASSLIADMTRLTSLVVMPKSTDAVVRQLELVRLADRRILCVVIDEHDQVQNRVVDLLQPVTDAVLHHTLYLLNTAMAGFHLDEGRERLISQIKQADPEVQQLIQHALFGDTIEINEQLIFTSGETRLINHEISEDIQTLRKIVRTFEQVQPLNNALSHCIHSDEVSVLLAEEIGVEELKNCALIAKPFYKDGKVAGVLSVIGPIRMDYRSIIPAVDMTANILTSALNQ